MDILVTDVKYRMSLAAIRDLSEAGHRVHLLHFGEGAPPAFASRYASGRFVRADTEGADRADAIFECAGAIGSAPAVFPVGAKSLAALAQAGPRPEAATLCPSADALRFANNKARVAALARELGVPAPEEYPSPDDAEFPAVVKYRDGEALGLDAPRRYRIVKDRAALDDAFRDMSAAASAGGQPPPLIQRYIPGDGYGVSAVFDRDGRPVNIICHHRLREYPITGGPSALCETVWEPRLVEWAVALLQALGWRGVAMAEFKGTPETGFRLLEINPRIWGSFPLTRAAKTGFSEDYVRAASGEWLPEYREPHYPLGVKMGFRYSNLAAALSYGKKLKLGKAAAAAVDALTVRDGVLERSDPAVNKAYKRYVFLERNSQ
ncbi:MAG: hypothetical protein IKE57_00735 [Oscillospiraceae bacterium]|nr:hypothetical protein [Oscillospiraceae bacterium]